MAENSLKKTPAVWPGSPLGDFRKQMNDLVENFFGSPRQSLGDVVGSMWGNAGNFPAIDVSEDKDSITLTAELPGMAESDVDLHVEDGVLTLTGEKKSERDETKDNYHVSERSYGAFRRSLTLPDRIDADKINAKFDKGVLKVTMPKKSEAKASQRKIAIEK